METVTKGLIALAALAFVLAAISALTSNTILGMTPESFSRACSNLALLAIAIAVVFGRKSVTA